MLVRSENFRASKIMEARVRKTENITILMNHDTVEVLGDNQVVTGVSFLFLDPTTKKVREHLFFDSTEVTFNEITTDLMDAYIATGDSLDKAGAYGIQGPSLTFISRVNGSYSNVVGFPLDKIVSELKIILGDDWRKSF
jgi:predicted house-cleaning NTP pyrophosphatase (Maf/HAM1 superfamily)